MIAVATRDHELGAFAEWQPRYAEHGIATFPVVIDGTGKRPAVKGYLKVGSILSQELARRFPANDAFGFALGRSNRITVLDVDTADERVLSDALAKHGASPLIVRSGSGNWQAWYRHNGEGRHVRPWGREPPIDVLGDGYVVAPPSAGTRRLYEITQASLDDLQHLPALQALDFLANASKAPAEAPGTAVAAVRDGERNNSLWRACMRHGLRCPSLDVLLDFARTHNEEEFMTPLAEAEVVRIAGSAWHYTEKGENWFATGGLVGLPRTAVDELASTDPHAFALFGMLRCWHGDRDRFVLAKETADKVGWTLRTFKAARRRLEETQQIRCLSRGGRRPNDPPVYAWK
jgi:hypothetical protein